MIASDDATERPGPNDPMAPDQSGGDGSDPDAGPGVHSDPMRTVTEVGRPTEPNGLSRLDVLG